MQQARASLPAIRLPMPLLASVAADDGAFDTMMHVILEHLGFGTRQGRSNVYDRWKIEGSLFNGREPDQNPLGF